MVTTPQISEKSIVVLQLERKRKVVEQLRRKLNSYRCMPKTQLLYEKKENLKRGLDRLAHSTEELLATLRLNSFMIMNYEDDVERRLEEFDLLHREVQAYVRSTQG